jgi:Na+-translocating ferredoxin:NAD+ oxidoreductase RnfD subunit
MAFPDFFPKLFFTGFCYVIVSAISSIAETKLMQQSLLRPDPRRFQVIFQAIFLSYGILILNWNADWLHYFISIGGCLVFQYTADSVRARKLMRLNEFDRWGFSVLISAMSLCLLLKTNHWSVSLLASFLTVASKYLFQWNHKHIFNPSAFGIVITLLITNDAWLSPSQWGSNAVIFFGAVTLGTIVVTRVQKLDVSLAFLLTYVGLLYWRQVYVLGWPLDYFIHSVSTGSLLLFTFFMISDPRTSPNHPVARILWAVIIASIAFYLAAFKWKYNTMIVVLVATAPMVPVLDKIFKADLFHWKNASFINRSHLLFSKISIISGRGWGHKLKTIVMKPFTKKLAALIILASMVSHEAAAFCGFYVSKADGTLKNKTSQVILVRDGDKTVITMFNDFKGNMKDFAMVVPVPVVLKKSDIKVVDQQIFTKLNEYSKPRLVEYYDQNPCSPMLDEDKVVSKALSGSVRGLTVQGYAKDEAKVKIEAKYIVGEYDILILSAQESTALKTWLDENGYKIPAGAEEVLEPYIKSNLKFFVVKVNEEEKKKLPGNFLRPIQIKFSSPKFMLPIRLGMANADGDQDMIVYAFTKKGRIESTNYRTVSLPTGKNIPLFVQSNFGSFYTNLVQHQWDKEGKAVTMLEYAWDVSPKNYVKCDPCVATAPSTQDLVQAGVWWINRDWNDYSDVTDQEDYSGNVYFTRLHVRYNRSSFPQDLFFQVTPNTENFQARYIITHPASGDFTCDAGKKYLKELKQRRTDEMEMLTYLTGKTYNDWDVVMNDEEKFIPMEASYAGVSKNVKATSRGNNGFLFAAISVVGLVSLIGFRKRR